MRKRILTILFCCVSLLSFAEGDVLAQLITDLMHMGGKPTVIEERDGYLRIQLTDSATIEAYEWPDSIVVIRTVCAPQCSSCARIYNKEWQLLRVVQPPFTSVFPWATIEPQTGRIIWKDNDSWEY